MNKQYYNIVLLWFDFHGNIIQINNNIEVKNCFYFYIYNGIFGFNKPFENAILYQTSTTLKKHSSLTNK